MFYYFYNYKDRVICYVNITHSNVRNFQNKIHKWNDYNKKIKCQFLLDIESFNIISKNILDICKEKNIDIHVTSILSKEIELFYHIQRVRHSFFVRNNINISPTLQISHYISLYLMIY